MWITRAACTPRSGRSRLPGHEPDVRRARRGSGSGSAALRCAHGTAGPGMWWSGPGASWVPCGYAACTSCAACTSPGRTPPPTTPPSAARLSPTTRFGVRTASDEPTWGSVGVRTPARSVSCPQPREGRSQARRHAPRRFDPIGLPPPPLRAVRPTDPPVTASWPGADPTADASPRRPGRPNNNTRRPARVSVAAITTTATSSQPSIIRTSGWLCWATGQTGASQPQNVHGQSPLAARHLLVGVQSRRGLRDTGGRADGLGVPKTTRDGSSNRRALSRTWQRRSSWIRWSRPS